MGSARSQRVFFFAAALAALIAGALGLSLAAHRGTHNREGSSPVREGRKAAPILLRGVQSKSEASALRTAVLFVHAFLRYQVGLLDPGTRVALHRLGSQRFAAELLASPPRLPPGAKAPRVRYLGIAGLMPTLSDGSGAIVASVRLRTEGRGELLAVDLAKLGAGWAVVGIGR
jgi:hypothetical protein